MTEKTTDLIISKLLDAANKNSKECTFFPTFFSEKNQHCL